MDIVLALPLSGMKLKELRFQVHMLILHYLVAHLKRLLDHLLLDRPDTLWHRMAPQDTRTRDSS